MEERQEIGREETIAVITQVYLEPRSQGHTE